MSNFCRPSFRIVLLVMGICCGCTRGPNRVETSVDGQVEVDSVEKSANSLYTVDQYDASRDVEADLATTVARATAENKRILLEIGGDW